MQTGSAGLHVFLLFSSCDCATCSTCVQLPDWQRSSVSRAGACWPPRPGAVICARQLGNRRRCYVQRRIRRTSGRSMGSTPPLSLRACDSPLGLGCALCGRSGGQRTEADAAESRHRALAVASSAVQRVSVITADTPVDANSIHSTAISPELARTIEAGSSRPCRPRAAASVSTTTLGAGRIPSSVLINAPLALTFSRQPRHLQPLSRACMHLSRTGMLVESRCPQRCSIDLSVEPCRFLCCVRLGHAAIRNSPYTAVHGDPAKQSSPVN